MLLNQLKEKSKNQNQARKIKSKRNYWTIEQKLRINWKKSTLVKLNIYRHPHHLFHHLNRHQLCQRRLQNQKSIASVLPSTSAASSLTLPPSLDLIVNRVNVSHELSSINSTSSSEVNSLDQSETTAKTVLDQMKKDKLPKKVFKNGDKTFGYSAVLQFTKSKTAVTKGEVICFVCVFCGSKTNVILGSTSNVNGHFDSCHTFKDKDFLVWYNGYKAAHPSVQNKTLITRETLNIVEYFISSNTAQKEFDSVHFREFFSNYSFKILCARNTQ